MLKNIFFNKKLIKFIIILGIFEVVYLSVIPYCFNKFFADTCLKSIVNNKINAEIDYKNLKLKTYFLPFISIKADYLCVSAQENNEKLVNIKSPFIKIYLLPVLFKNIKVRNFTANSLLINLEKDINGNYNFQKIFSSDKKIFKFNFENFSSDISKINLNFSDYQNNKSNTPFYSLDGKNFKTVINSRKKLFNLIFQGNIIYNNEENGNFDVNLKAKYPFTKDFDNNLLSGYLIICNLNLDTFKPIIQYFDPDLSEINGFVDYINISSKYSNDDTNKISINTSFNNLIYNKTNWNNHIIANGNHKINSTAELKGKEIKINSFNYTAENINIKSHGNINLEKKPDLDISVKIKNSKAENIASILPPNLVPQYMTIEKVKKYGVYGDIDADVNIKGKIPQPDITGFVKGRNVHILDKSLHKLHKGTVDINFDKRILNMNIIVDMADKQKAEVKGSVYMFRDGINHVIVKTTNNIDFPLAQKIIIPISKVFNFQLGPIPEMDIKKGKGIIDLDIKGSPDLIDINGVSLFDNAKLSYNGLYGTADNGKGRLDFNGDVISFKSERAFVNNNPLKIDGKVKINDFLDFNISSESADADNLINIINNSELLKDVKAGIAIITKASGKVKLTLNLKAKIVPVPFGQPPLPPEEAFEDMKVKGSLYLFSDNCFIEGFYTPIKKIKGIVDFTETVVDLQNLEAVSGSSPIKISGQIVTDLVSKIPDVDIIVTSKSVNLKDTIKFLTESYLYPKNYPDLSVLYNIASKHDLYFKYKAKSIDFITDKAYAVMNFINDNTIDPIKAESGKVVLQNSDVKLENIKASVFDSCVSVTGNIKNVDSVKPIYNLKINSDEFNLSNLNKADEIKILPEKIKSIIMQFNNYTGSANINFEIIKNIMNGQIEFKKFAMKHDKTKAPCFFDDFTILFNKDKIKINNFTAQTEDIPIFGDLTIDNIFKKPVLKGYFTSKLTDSFVKNYLSENIAKKLTLVGDINLSAEIDNPDNNLNLKTKLTLNPDADISFDGTNIGDIADKREFDSSVKLTDKEIYINKFDYIKYISSQNNRTYPIVFASLTGILQLNKNNQVILEKLHLKTNKNLSARFLNLFLNKPILKQGTFNCNLKLLTDLKTGTAKLLGNFDCQNIDIPIFDTVLKNIKINADNNKIDINLFGLMSDDKIRINSVLENKLNGKPVINSLNIYADKFNINKFFANLSQTLNAMNTENNIKNIDLSGLAIKKGYLDIKELNIKALTANNIKSHFAIDHKGIFTADNIQLNVGEGDISGQFVYNLLNTEFNCDFELHNVDSNYIAETVFDGKNQIYGNANGKIILQSKGNNNTEIIKNLSGFIYFEILEGRMPKLGSLEYLLRAGNIIKSGITGLTLNSILEILNLVKTGYFSNITGHCKIENGIADNIEIYSTGENLSLYIHGKYNISQTHADLEVLGKLSKKISTIFGAIGNTSLNTFFKLIPGISLLDFGRKDFIEDVEKIPSFTNGDYESRTFQAIINGDINNSNYVQSFKWVK